MCGGGTSGGDRADLGLGVSVHDDVQDFGIVGLRADHPGVCTWGAGMHLGKLPCGGVDLQRREPTLGPNVDVVVTQVYGANASRTAYGHTVRVHLPRRAWDRPITYNSDTKNR